MNKGFSAIGLVNPKGLENVGAVLRAAGCYGASMVAISGLRADHWIGRIKTDVQRAYRGIPVLRVADVLEAIPFDCAPVAVEFLPGARSLVDFAHPERAFYVFGPEDGTLGRSVIDRCGGRVVQVPTQHCMNLAATVNVVLYDRLAKQLTRGSRNGSAPRTTAGSADSAGERR
jgi:tRNA(Leu) C34 or U34 (ribose-2'-O)-methylase TrmL